jgi:hypothetical protein
MTAPTMPARPGKTDAVLRPVPWRLMAWVTWRQHRFALGGVAVLVGGLALYLWLAGLGLHHAYATAAACRPVSSLPCKNQVFNFDSAYGPTAQTVGTVLMAVPLLIGAFVGAPVLARELETGTFRYAWTLGVSRQRWTLAKLVPLAVTVAVATGLLSLLFSWYYQPLFTDGNSIPLEPGLFGLRGVAYAAWTLAAFTIGALAGLLIRRVSPRSPPPWPHPWVSRSRPGCTCDSTTSHRCSAGTCPARLRQRGSSAGGGRRAARRSANPE